MEYENLKDELLSKVDTALKHAKSVDNQAEYEIYLLWLSASEVNIEQGMVTGIDSLYSGNAVRVFKENKVSFAASSGLSIDRIERSITEAVSLIKNLSVKDERFKSFCDPKPPGREGAFASEILNITTSDLIDVSNRLIKDAKEVDERIKTIGGECSASWGGFAIGNSNGVQQASRSAVNSCFVHAMGIEGNDRRTGYGFDFTRERLVETEDLGETAAQKAISQLGGKKLDKTATIPTIWDNMASGLYIVASLARSANGQIVVEGQSPLADKIGDEIATSNLSVIDNGQKPSALGTHAIDAEGIPQGETFLIDKGILKEFIFNSYYANIFDTESTGNCSRSGGTLPYEAIPSIGTKSLEILPGTKGEDEIITSIDEQAILVKDFPMGIFHTNVSTGEFSIVGTAVFLVEDGEIQGPLQPVTIAGNFYTGLKNIREIGSDVIVTPFGIEAPTLLFDGFSVVG
jgi:PmbA protein